MHFKWIYFVTTLASLSFFNFICAEEDRKLQGSTTGQTNFRALVTAGKYFVDKSLFIKDVMVDKAKITAISRPRKFGKSINLSMLYYFLTRDGNYKNLFQNLSIAREEDLFCKLNQNRHPVIMISFAYNTWDSYEEALEGLKIILSYVFSRNKYLLKGKNVTESEKEFFDSILNKSAMHTETTQAIFFLVDLMNRFHKKNVVLLIDECDVPLRRAYFNGYYDQMVLMMKMILQKVLEKNSALRRAVIMSTTSISFQGSFLGINFVEINTVRSLKYSKYFGFTYSEVEEMLEANECSARNVENLKEHYGGYFMGNFKMFSPLSVTLSMKTVGAVIMNNFWAKTAGRVAFRYLMFNCGALPILYSEILLKGGTLSQELESKVDLSKIKDDEKTFWSFVTYLGYLSFGEKATGNAGRRTLRLPNKEVTSTFNTVVEAYFRKHSNIPRYGTFMGSLRYRNSTIIQNCLESYINNSKPFFKGKTLADFENLMSRILSGLVKEYGPLTTNREGATSTIVLGPSIRSARQLVFVLKEVKPNEDTKASPVKEVWVKFCSLFKGNETSIVSLSLCDGLFELKLKIK